MIVNYFIDCDCELFLSIVIVNCIINFVSKVKGMTISSKLLLENEVYGCSAGTPTTHRFRTITVQRIRIIMPCLQESGYASYLHYITGEWICIVLTLTWIT